MQRAYWLSGLLLLAGCANGAGPNPVGQSEQEQTEDEDEGDRADDGSESDKSPSNPRRPQGDAGRPSTGSKDAGPSSDDKVTSPATQKNGIPCDVQKVVASKCAECHQGEGKFGAPMPLESQDDFHQKSDDGRAYHEVALARVTGKEKPMMPPASHALTADEKSKLVAWLTEEAPESTESCSGSKPSADSSTDEEEVVDCDIEMELRAGSEGKPFTVPTTPDYYHCFYFKPDFAAGTLGKGFLPLIDNEQVIHHWLLFVKDDATKKPGTSEQCTGVNPGATLIAGWAPGGQSTTAPKDVGIQLPRGPNVIYQLELHYNNTVGPSATDKSGVKLCATTKPQKQEAAIHYLGSENILILPGTTGTAGSTCRPKGPVTLLSVNPHMHKTGAHAKMVINRKNGTQEVYHDAPFSFESQINYRKTAVLEAGDTITSTCTFKNDTSSIKVFQEGTNDEMCYLFTLAYPVGAMDTGSDLLGVGLPGPNRCMR